MLAVAIAGGLGGGTYISQWNGEEIDTAISKLLLPGGILTTDLADSSVTWPKLAPEARKSNPNLLDNAYFIGGGSQQGGGQFPINQRGLTEYTELGYTIDRWQICDGGKLVLNDDYITFSGQSSAGYDNLRQTIEPSKFRGLNLVFSVLYRSSTTDWLIVAKRIGLSDISVDLLNTQGEFKLATLNVTVNSTSNTGYFAIMRRTVGAQSNIDIIAAKLELGPHQTLAYESGGGGP